MNTYVTEEEQIEAIKKWWNRYGNGIMTVLIIILLAYSGWKYWIGHEKQVKINASASYEQMMIALSNNDDTGVKAQANTLLTDYKKTVYADVANLVLAKLAITNKDYQAAQMSLQSVIDTGHINALKQIARLRLARIQQANKGYQQALKSLSTIDDNAYLALVFEQRGDIYSSQGDSMQAKENYAKALKQSPDFALKNPALMMKLKQVTG